MILKAIGLAVMVIAILLTAIILLYNSEED